MIIHIIVVIIIQQEPTGCQPNNSYNNNTRNLYIVRLTSGNGKQCLSKRNNAYFKINSISKMN